MTSWLENSTCARSLIAYKFVSYPEIYGAIIHTPIPIVREVDLSEPFPQNWSQFTTLLKAVGVRRHFTAT